MRIVMELGIMTVRLLFLALLFLQFGLPEICSAQERRSIDLGKGGSLRWSPNGNHVSFIRDSALLIYSLEKNTVSRAGNVTSRQYAWLSDTQMIFFEMTWIGSREGSRYPMKLTFTTIDTTSWSLTEDSVVNDVFEKTRRPSLRIGHQGVVAVRAGNIIKPVSPQPAHARGTRIFGAVSHYPPGYRAGKPIHDDTDIWLVDIDGNEIKRVTTGKKYILPKLAPNGALLTCYETTVEGAILIIDTSGNEHAYIGRGDGATWSRDSDVVYYHVSTDDGHRILTADLFRYTLSTGLSEQLTFSPEIIESGGVPSPDGKWLAYKTTIEGKNPGHVILLSLAGDR